MRILLMFFASILAAGCSSTANTTKPANTVTNTAPAKASPVPIYGYEVVKSYPHDPKAFTQGLFFYNGFLYEGTGQEGESTVRKIDLETGKVLQKVDLPKKSFGEGITLHNNQIYQLTWQEGICRVYDLETLKPVREFIYQGQGWGLASDGKNLFMTDSTHVLRVMDPETFRPVRTLPVMREDGQPLMQINELEFVKGELWANIWHSEDKDILGKPNYIARIDPTSGKVVGWIDLAGISPDDQPKTQNPYDEKVENTLNGIAYDAAGDRIFVTGKKWKKLYEIKVAGPKNQ